MYLKILINDLRFQRFSVDLYIFTIYIRGLIVGFYINNLIIAAKKFKNVLWFKNFFLSRYKIKDLKKYKKILSIKIRRNRKKREMFLN